MRPASLLALLAWAPLTSALVTSHHGRIPAPPTRRRAAARRVSMHGMPLLVDADLGLGLHGLHGLHDLGLVMATKVPPFDPSALSALDWTMYSFMLPVSCLVAFLANTAGIGR